MLSSNTVAMDGKMIKAARHLLGWSQTELCRRAGISRATLNDIENNRGDPRKSSTEAVEQALRSEGIVFTDDGTWRGIHVPANR